MILLIGTETDPHLSRVGQELELLGMESRVLDFSVLGGAVGFEAGISNRTGPEVRLTAADWSLSTDRVGALWLRRPHRPAVIGEVSDADDRRFARNEWRAAIDGIAASLAPGRVVNPPAAERAATKIRQLKAAARLGLRIPDTLVTSSPAAVRSFAEKHGGRVIHKASTAPPHAFVETRRLSAADIELLDLAPLAPVMVQEEITGPADLRVTVAGERLYAALIPPAGGDDGDAEAVDSRLNLSWDYRPFEIDRDVARRLKALLTALGLTMGTVDLKLLESGDCVFFEINPQGQFLYVEIMTGQEISKGVAATLAEIARREERANP